MSSWIIFTFTIADKGIEYFLLITKFSSSSWILYFLYYSTEIVLAKQAATIISKFVFFTSTSYVKSYSLIFMFSFKLSPLLSSFFTKFSKLY